MAQTNILGLIVQFAQLEKAIRPHLPAVSKKLVTDLLNDGVEAKSLASVVGRSPSYLRAVAAGKKTLSAADLTRIIEHVGALNGN